MNRELTDDERALVQWMLENGNPDARNFLPQLALATVTPYRCSCGCPSMAFEVEGYSNVRSAGLRILAEFVYDFGEDAKGIFVYEQNDVLAGIEVYCFTDTPPAALPSINQLCKY